MAALFASLCFPSCIKEEVRLTRNHKKLIDSLTALQTTVLRDEMDSLCDIELSERIHIYTDSIVQVRLAEIRRKIEIEAYEQRN